MSEGSAPALLTSARRLAMAVPAVVEKTIERVFGVSRVTVSFKDKAAIAVFEDAKATADDLTDAATNPGFR